MGGGLAASTGDFAILPFAAALLGALWIQIGTNYANDYSDFVRGADTGQRRGSTRVTQAGLLSPSAVRRAAAASFVLAALFGVYLVARGGWPIVWIGLISVAAGICYTGGPWPFGYHGLGDLFVFLFFGPVAVAGTVYVQTLEWRPDAVLAGVAAGALTTAILVVNNLRDRPTDEAAGKRTLAVVIGERATRFEYVALAALAAAVPFVGVIGRGWPTGSLLAVVALAALVTPLRGVFAAGDPRALNEVLARTARAAGLYGLAFAAGCLL